MNPLLFFLFWLALAPPLLAAEEKGKEEAVKEKEEVEDIFAPSIRPRVSLVPPQSGEKQMSARLDGIGLGAGRAFAVVNGRVYQEGEEKEGIRVTKIRKREADILINGRAETLELIPAEGLAGLAGPSEIRKSGKQDERASDENEADRKPQR